MSGGNGVDEGIAMMVRAFGEFFIGIKNDRQARKQREATALAARQVEARSAQQQKQWIEMVERQMSHGDAGDATEEEAIAALGGSGGRPNDLDKGWF